MERFLLLILTWFKSEHFFELIWGLNRSRSWISSPVVCMPVQMYWCTTDLSILVKLERSPQLVVPDGSLRLVGITFVWILGIVTFRKNSLILCGDFRTVICVSSHCIVISSQYFPSSCHIIVNYLFDHIV